MTAPASWSLVTTVAEYGLEKPFKMAEAHVVGSSVVHMLSLIEIVKPSIADLGVPMNKMSSMSRSFQVWSGSDLWHGAHPHPEGPVAAALIAPHCMRAIQKH